MKAGNAVISLAAPLRFVTTRIANATNQSQSIYRKAWEAIAHTQILLRQPQQQIKPNTDEILEQEGLANSIQASVGLISKNYAIALNNSSSVSPKFQAAVVLSIKPGYASR